MKLRLSLLFVACFGSLAFVGLPSRAEDPKAWEVEKALELAGDNRKELVKALTETPAEQRKGMAFLVANMPNGDLKTLKADFLLENVRLAYKAHNETPWGKSVPEEIFLNDVLPYANVDESRDPWRKEMYDLCMPIVKDCKTLGEATHQLNSIIFTKLKVKYSTQRKLPNQSPKESIEQGLASCTGLSVILSDACRSVGIPARLVGTPLWANKRGNHTWVEIWDGRWHFTGACEADPKGLDRGWFVGDAAQAQKDSRLHAIYATSFRKTETTFPLVWAPNRKDVYAENVTDHYTAKPEAPKEGHTKIMVRVWNAGKKSRVTVPLTIFDKTSGKEIAQGESRGEKDDTNNITTFELLKNHDYLIHVGKPMRIELSLKTTAEDQTIVEIEVPAKDDKKPSDLSEIEKAASAYFSASPEKQAEWKFDAKLNAELTANEEAVRAAVWKAYQAAPIHAAQKKDYDENQVRFEKYQSAYVVREVGKRPEKGWPLFIAMHGGGNAPKSLNDSQWKQMQTYYRDQKDVTGYKYLALRAPNDTWNGFYDTYVPPLIYNLIRQFAVFGDIDTDKLFIMGYSHGGYGAFYIGPKIPDRFAAIHCSASAPNRRLDFAFDIAKHALHLHGRRKRHRLWPPRALREIRRPGAETQGRKQR